jgi:dynein heavy chain
MQHELQDLQPILARTSQEVEDMMVVITNDKREADETKRVVERQEKEANEQAARAKEIADDAQVRCASAGLKVQGSLHAWSWCSLHLRM